jgi:hypothetical protein
VRFPDADIKIARFLDPQIRFHVYGLTGQLPIVTKGMISSAYRRVKLPSRLNVAGIHFVGGTISNVLGYMVCDI